MKELLDAKGNSWDKELRTEFRNILKLRSMIEENIKTRTGSAQKKWVYVAKCFNRIARSFEFMLVEKGLFISEIEF